jgi:hypothetical protein
VSDFDTKYTYNMQKQPKTAQKKDFMVQNPYFIQVVPPGRLNLACSAVFRHTTKTHFLAM